VRRDRCCLVMKAMCCSWRYRLYYGWLPSA